MTGGAGFIGSFLVDALVARGHAVTVLDNLETQVHLTSKPAYLNPAARYVWGDVTAEADLKEVVPGAEVILHQAAVVGVGQSQYQIRRYVQTNILGTAALLDLLANHPHHCKKLIVASSMSAYGEGLYECVLDGKVRPPLRSETQMAARQWELTCPLCNREVMPIPIPETAELRGNSFYALTKKAQEEMVLLFGKTYGLPTVALRYFNVYGPRQSMSNPYTGVAAIFASRLKNAQLPMVYEDGGQTRDFCSVHDVVQANLLAIDKPAANGEVFNVGSGTSISILEVARQLARLYNRPPGAEITHRFRKGDVRHAVADIQKIQTLLGYTPQIDFASGMAELLEWSRDTPAIDRFDRAARELIVRGLA